MKVLVTGSNGFIGKNLCLGLKDKGYDVIQFDKDSTKKIDECVAEADFVMHLAGVNRPLNNEEFYDGNTNLTFKLIDLLKKQNRKIPVLLSSSVQAEKDNDYGKSKKKAEDLIFAYHKETGSPVYVFRLANAFGKWCKPNYNSVVATFCYNITHGLDIQVNDPNAMIPFVYIDDIANAFINCINADGSNDYLSVNPVYKRTLGELVKALKSFKDSRNDFMIPNMEDGFIKKLYSTYLSYLPEDEFAYDLKMNIDQRGSFTEFVKSNNRGQVSINISHPGIVKGNHWHHTKNEKFLVVSGKGIIRFRKIGHTKIIEYTVSGEKLEVVDIPTGYTHNIENVGDTDMVTVMWCNETYDKDNPDTFYEEV